MTFVLAREQSFLSVVFRMVCSLMNVYALMFLRRGPGGRAFGEHYKKQQEGQVQVLGDHKEKPVCPEVPAEGCLQVSSSQRTARW